MKKKYVIVLLVLLVCAGIGWRMWPHSFASAIRGQSGDIAGIRGFVSYYEYGTSSYELMSSTLDSSLRGEEAYQRIMSALESTQYREDFRNIPLKVGLLKTISADGTGAESATIVLNPENDEQGTIELRFLSDSRMDVYVEQLDQCRIYHPVDDSVFSQIIECVQQQE